MVDPKIQAQAVGHIPSGMFIIATKNENSVDGYLASWVQQISFSPLMIAVAINPSRPGYETIVNGGVFTVNVVGDHETQYLRHFWSGYAPEKNPFVTEVAHEVKSSGAVVIQGAKSAIECRMISKIKPGDHEIVLAEVTNSFVLSEEAKPKVHIRKSGLDY